MLLADYEGAHEDYLELFIQFGFVLLFIVTYPLACLGALVNNVFELPVDAFKLTRINRRPPVMRVGHIGAWQPAFRILCSIAVATNCALLFLMFRTVPDASEASEDAEASAGAWHRALVCVSLDHALLVAQMLLGVVVPAFPAWVRIAQAKERRLQRSWTRPSSSAYQSFTRFSLLHAVSFLVLSGLLGRTGQKAKKNGAIRIGFFIEMCLVSIWHHAINALTMSLSNWFNYWSTIHTFCSSLDSYCLFQFYTLSSNFFPHTHRA